MIMTLRGCDFSRGFNTKVLAGSPSHRKVEVHLLGAATLVADLASESIELAIEMESESPSTIYAGLKLLTPWVFGLHLAMAKITPCSMQDFTGD